MSEVQTSNRPSVRIKIGDANENELIHKFHWRSFYNDGYIIRARFPDPYFAYLEEFGLADYLDKGRKEPVEISFDMGWVGFEDQRTSAEDGMSKALISDLCVHGYAQNAEVEFIAIDPASYYLNAGSGDGGVYEGKVSEVIKAIVNKYAPSLTLTIDDTTDSPNNQWWMMRQDPKTFIKTILTWAPAIAKNKTTWYTAVRNYEFCISELSPQDGDDIIYNIITEPNASTDVVDMHFLANTFLSNYQSQLEVAGISATTGQYIDKETNPEKAIIKDSNTQNKLNCISDENLGFAKPLTEYSTYMPSIPEFNGGELGIAYPDYISGIARGKFIDMLSFVMRMKITVHGDTRINNGCFFRKGTINLLMYDPDGEPYFDAGRWIIYGFEHRFSMIRKEWYTDIWLYRFDYNAEAIKI